MQKTGKYKSGFTLIEVLVVVSIISILIAIIMPSLNKVKQKASAVVCMSNLDQWYLIINMSTNDRNGYFHSGWGGHDNTEDDDWWMGDLRDYYDDIEEFRCCPMAKKESKSPPFKAWYWDETQDIGSYLMNGWVENKPDKYFSDESGTEFQLRESAKPNYWRNIKKIRRASRVPLMTDSNWLDAWPEASDGPQQNRDSYWEQSSQFGRICVDRHYKRQNVLFMDGSIETIDLKQIWTLKWHRNFNTAGEWTMAGGVESSDWPKWIRNYKEY